MRKILMAIIILGSIMLRVGYAEESTHHALAEQLLTMMDVQKNMEQSLEMVKQMQAAQLQQMEVSADKVEKVQSMTEQMMDMIAEEMSWDKLKDDYVSVYVDIFTEEELKGIIEFYETPIGQKFIKKTPELMKRSMEVSQKQMVILMPKIQAMTKEMIEKWKKEREQEIPPKEQNTLEQAPEGDAANHMPWSGF